MIAEFTGSPLVSVAPLDSSTTAGNDSPPVGLNGASAMIVMIVVLGLVFVVTRWRSQVSDAQGSPAAPDNSSMEPGR